MAYGLIIFAVTTT